MSHSEEEVRDAERKQELVRQKLLDIMDLQADIDLALRDIEQSPFGSAKWENARPEELQRLVLMGAIQFVAFEPDEWVEGNDKFKAAADEMMSVLSDQLKWLKEKYHEQ